MNTTFKKVGLLSLSLILVMVLLLLNFNLSIDQGKAKLTVTVGDPVNAAGVSPDVNGTTSTAVQTALDMVANTGGEVSFVSSSYTFTGTVARAIDNVVFKLNGATITNDGVTPLFNIGSQKGWSFYDGKLDAGGITLSSGTNWTLNNVWFGTTYYSLRTDQTIYAGNASAPTGRGATYVIAASDATALEKAQADIVCDGTQTTGNDATILNPYLALGGSFYIFGNLWGSGFTIVSNTHLSGSGSINLTNSVNVDLIQSSNSAALSNVWIDGLTLNGNRTNQNAGNTIHLWNPDNLFISNCEIKNGYAANIALSHISNTYNQYGNVHITDNNIHHGGNGVDLNPENGSYAIYDTKITGNTIRDSGGTGVFSQGSGKVSITGGSVSSCLIGIYLKNATRPAISGVRVEYNSRQNLYLQSVSYGDVTGCVFRNGNYGSTAGTYSSVYVTYSSVNTNVSENVFHEDLNASKYCIEEESGSPNYNKYCSNSFSGWHTGAIKILGANDLVSVNHGYIAPGEIRTYSGTIGTLTENAFNSLDNPFGQAVRVLSLDFYISTAAGDTTPNSTIDSGLGSSATTDYTTLFEGVDCEVTGFYNSVNSATIGKQTVPQLWASGSGNRYLNMSIKDAAATGMVCKYTVTVMGN